MPRNGEGSFARCAGDAGVKTHTGTNAHDRVLLHTPLAMKMAETAWNAGFSRHALRNSAAHGTTSTCDMVLSATSAPAARARPAAVR